MALAESTTPPPATPYESLQPHPSGVSDGNYPSLPQPLVDELRELVLGEVLARIDKDFKPHTTLFNGNVVTPAKALVIPANTEDVSKILKFCSKHMLQPSIKAGGYGTAGWAINGDIVIDLRSLNGIHIEPPLHFGEGNGKEFTSLKNMQGLGGIDKGKTRAENFVMDGISASTDTTGSAIGDGKIPTGKRRRSAEASPSFDSGRNDLPRDPLVAKFLWAGEADFPSPAVKRRLDLDYPLPPNESATSQASTPKVEIETSESGGKEHLGGSTLTRTTPPRHPSSEGESSETNRTPSNDGTISTSTSTTTLSASSNSTSTSTALTSPSTAPTSPGVKSPDSDKHEASDVEFQIETGGDALGMVLSVPEGHRNQNQSSLVSRLQNQFEENVIETGVASPEGYVDPPPASHAPPSTSFNIRTEDPFGYLSAPPSVPAPVSGLASSVRPSRGYEQSVFEGGGNPPRSLDTNRPGPSSVPVLLDRADAAGSFLSEALTPVHPHAYVSFGAGERQKDIDIFTAEHSLPATSPSGNVGEVAYHIPLAAHPVGSSVMLLGGFGFLSRLYGLSIDALVEVEMVLADGSIIYVNEKEHPDLWWALRGAGPAFGVVTRYKAKAYPVPVVFAGNLIYNFHISTAASLIKHFRDCVKSAPRELYANVLLTAGPADKGSLVVVQLCYVGNKERGKEFLEAIGSWDGEPCLLNEVSEKSFLAQQDSVAQILRGKAGRQWFIRSALITSLPDEIIHKTVNEFADTPVGCTWLFELAGGAVSDTDDTTCLPKSQREAGFTIAAFHQWELDDDDPLCVTTAEDWIEKTLAPVSTGGPYPAFLGRHESSTRIMGCFGSNWDRLVEVKRKYDPRGLFRHNFWPLDEEGRVCEPCVREPKSPVMRPGRGLV